MFSCSPFPPTRTPTCARMHQPPAKLPASEVPLPTLETGAVGQAPGAAGAGGDGGGPCCLPWRHPRSAPHPAPAQAGLSCVGGEKWACTLVGVVMGGSGRVLDGCGQGMKKSGHPLILGIPANNI